MRVREGMGCGDGVDVMDADSIEREVFERRMTVVMSTGSGGQQSQPPPQSQQSSQSHPNQSHPQSETTHTTAPTIETDGDQSSAQASNASNACPHASSKFTVTQIAAKTGRKGSKTTKTLSDNNLNSDNSEDVSHISSTSHHKSNESLNTSVDMIETNADCDDLEVKEEELGDNEEPDFPVDELNKLDDMINKPRWVIPVLPKGELEVLLDTTIRLCKHGYDVRSEPCQRFIREGLTISFTKILTDEAVNGWKFDIH
ncbi:unnamed protein product, partial [Medioppia subpectinata]